MYGTDDKGAVKLLAAPRALAVDGKQVRLRVRHEEARSPAVSEVPGPVSVAASTPVTGSSQHFDFDVSVTPSIVKGTDRIHLDLDVSVSSSDRGGSGVRMRQWRRKAKLQLKDGELFRFDLAAESRDLRQLEILALRVE